MLGRRCRTDASLGFDRRSFGHDPDRDIGLVLVLGARVGDDHRAGPVVAQVEHVGVAKACAVRRVPTKRSRRPIQSRGDRRAGRASPPGRADLAREPAVKAEPVNELGVELALDRPDRHPPAISAPLHTVERGDPASTPVPGPSSRSALIRSPDPYPPRHPLRDCQLLNVIVPFLSNQF